MSGDFSTPLTELPGFLSTISMVGEDQRKIIEHLTQAERKSPSRYGPAREHFISVLNGKLSYDDALRQIGRLRDPTEKRCALEIFKKSEKYLTNETTSRTGPFSSISTNLPNGLKLDISSIWIRHLEQQKLLVLHFWKTALLDRQLSAAGATLIKALSENGYNHSNFDLDFISVSLAPNGSERVFRRYDWLILKPFTNQELAAFWKPFLEAWEKYKRLEPRRIKRRRAPNLFGS